MKLRSTATPKDAEIGALAALQLEIAQEMGGVYPFQWFPGSEHFGAGAAFNALLGLSSDVPARVVDLFMRIAPEDREGLDATRRRVLAGEERFDAEFRIVSEAGPRWVLARG
ncbi:hypothetical protein CNY89_23490, partial [Amaricoccus sp. HAR-UPW-R2A-40]